MKGSKAPFSRFWTMFNQQLQLHVLGSHKTSFINNQQKRRGSGVTEACLLPLNYWLVIDFFRGGKSFV